MRRSITIGEVLEAHAFSVLSGVYKCMPGIVTAYTPGSAGQAPPLVDVQPAVHDVRFDPELGARVSEPWPILPKVPVVFSKFGGFALYGPMKQGDKVLLLSWDLDPTKHRFTGNAEDPIYTRRHGGNFWVAIPGDITDPGGLPDPGQAVVLGTPGGIVIAIDVDGINLGSASATDKVGLGSKIDAAVATIVNAFNLHTHLSAAPGSPTSPPATPIATQAPTGSARVKCDP